MDIEYKNGDLWGLWGVRTHPLHPPGYRPDASTEVMTVPGNEVINLCESEDEISDIVEEIVKECENCQNPTEILRCAQNKIVTGRQLDITDPTSELFGDTNFFLS